MPMQENFWRDIILFVVGLIIIHFIVTKIVLRKNKNKTKISNILMNAFLGLALAFFFYRYYRYWGAETGLWLMLQFIIRQIDAICILVLATTGIILIFKTSYTTNFAQGMIATIGAFVAARYVMYITSTYMEFNYTEMFLAALLFGALASFLFGVFVDVAIIRNSKDQSPVGKQMITMGLVIILLGLIPVIFGVNPMPVYSFMVEPQYIQFEMFGMAMPFTVTPHSLFSIGITVVLLTLLFTALRFTKWGLGVRATASNERVANMMGVNTKLITAMSWGIAGLLGAVAAIILAPSGTTVSAAMMTSTQVNGFLAAVLGSFTSFAGPIITSILMPILSGLLSLITPWKNIIVYLIILVVVLIKPLGLFGKKVSKKV